MTTPAYNQTMPDIVIPYITRDQYRAAPTAINTQSLIRGGSQADQDAELDRLILEASAWCDKAAEQPLTAQVTTETMRAQVGKDGRLRLHPRQHPIIAVTGATFGADPTMMSTLSDLSGVWVENQSVEVPLQSALNYGFTGPLQFGTARAGSRVFIALSYVAGFACTTLSGAALATDATLTVTDPTGLIPGVQVSVQQGGAPTGSGSYQSALTNARAIVLSVANNVVTLSKPIGAAFTAGAAVTAMPDEVRQACVYVTTAFIKQSGMGGLVMAGGKSATVSKGGEEPGVEEFDIAEAILSLYRPVAP